MTQMNARIENQGLRASGSRAPRLEGKSAVVLGAGGSIGAAVAKEFAAEGVRVLLAGQTRPDWKRLPTKSQRQAAKHSRPWSTPSMTPT
jgi:shikimate 5-dehydrogenase